MNAPAPARTLALPIVYPDSDGMPMSDNTAQFAWIQLLQANLDRTLADFVAGDLLWYPTEGDNRTRVAPDVLVALGRPKGYRGSYRTWDEAGVVPQVVVEVLSPSNSTPEMLRKVLFYQRHGVSEMWVVDPDGPSAYAYAKGVGGILEMIGDDTGFTSPLLGVRFAREGEELRVYHRDGVPFRTPKEEYQRAESERERAESERERAELERERADSAERRAARLAALLKAAGIDEGAG